MEMLPIFNTLFTGGIFLIALLTFVVLLINNINKNS
jgi:hypothetical protein